MADAHQPSRSPFAEYLPLPPARPAAVRATIAEATADRVEELAALQAGVRGGAPGQWGERIGRAMAHPRGTVAMALVDGAAVGYGSAAFLPAHAGDGSPAGYYLTGVTVAVPWRRHGLAGRLTRWRMDWAWERDPAVWCFISDENRASLDLHHALGFDLVRSGASFQGVGFASGQGSLLCARRP